MPTNPHPYPILAFGWDTVLGGNSPTGIGGLGPPVGVPMLWTVDPTSVKTWRFPSSTLAPGAALPDPATSGLTGHEGQWAALDTGGMSWILHGAGALGWNPNGIATVQTAGRLTVPAATGNRFYFIYAYGSVTLEATISGTPPTSVACGGLAQLWYGYGPSVTEWSGGDGSMGGVVAAVQVEFTCPPGALAEFACEEAAPPGEPGEEPPPPVGSFVGCSSGSVSVTPTKFNIVVGVRHSTAVGGAPPTISLAGGAVAEVLDDHTWAVPVPFTSLIQTTWHRVWLIKSNGTDGSWSQTSGSFFSRSFTLSDALDIDAVASIAASTGSGTQTASQTIEGDARFGYAATYTKRSIADGESSTEVFGSDGASAACTTNPATSGFIEAIALEGTGSGTDDQMAITIGVVISVV